MSFPALRIFIVDDHHSTLVPLRRYLRQLGHEVEGVETMASALAQIDPLKVDLVISDIGLPDGDGWELMRRLDPRDRFLAVAMSGHGTDEDKARSQAAGFHHHLVKPFLPDELDPLLAQAAQLAATRSAS